jgi:hypothetical protein
MSNARDLGAAMNDPKLLEEIYRAAERAGDTAGFTANIETLYGQSPDNLVLAAWHYRLHRPEPAAPVAGGQRFNWQLAVPLGLILGVVYWLLSGQSMETPDRMPYLLYLWAPIAALAIVALVTLGSAGLRPIGRSVAVLLGVLAVGFYALWLGDSSRQDYQMIAVTHLPILALVAVGLVVAGRGSDDQNRFAFLIKSTEAVVTGAIYGGATGLFLAITVGIYQPVGITFSDALVRLGASLAAGLIPILGVATVFDPRFSPIDQRFDDGLSKLISILGRFFLPFTLVVGVAYVITILFNFWVPFQQRDVLIVYNAMLFAVIGLLVFATPVTASGLSVQTQVWLRRGILAVAFLAALVSIYALSATVYRTAEGGITINRLAIIGWNVINIAILIHLLYRQLRSSAAAWLEAVWQTSRLGMIGYTVWTLFLVLAIPWLFPK